LEQELLNFQGLLSSPLVLVGSCCSIFRFLCRVLPLLEQELLDLQGLLRKQKIEQQEHN
jgi:hypothetical protein